VSEVNRPPQEITSAAFELLASVSIVEILPSIEQKVEFVERAIKTVLGIEKNSICIKGRYSIKKDDEKCAGCLSSRLTKDFKFFECKRSLETGIKSMKIETSEYFFGYLNIWDIDEERFALLSTALQNYLTQFSVSLEGLTRRDELTLLNKELQEEIDRRKGVEIELRKKAEELWQVNNTKDKMFSIISHDLRGPFHVLLNYSEMLADLDNDLTEEEMRETGKLLHTALENQFNLLTNLLEWSRLQTKGFTPVKKILKLRDEIERIVSQFDSLLAEKKLKLRILISESFQIDVDKGMLATVVRNLVSNSIKYSKIGGEIRVLAKVEGDISRLIVEDDGVGMSIERLSSVEIGELNSTVPGTVGERGIGLGLSLCRGLLENCNGFLTIVSEAGRGSKFTANFPH
jgi:signal transduction histidine kinase